MPIAVPLAPFDEEDSLGHARCSRRGCRLSSQLPQEACAAHDLDRYTTITSTRAG